MIESTQQPPAVRFGRCELHFETHELFVDGALQRLEPRVFGVLAYLVQHRNRVVSRDELLKQVWHTEFVTESVVARCIMKVRRATADVDNAEPLIKTLQRTGYRFVGAIQSVAPRARAAATRGRQRAPLRVAVLPFRNRSGDAALVWVELGLPALVSRTLEAQPGLTVIPLLETVAVLGGDASTLSADDAAALVHDELAASAVLSFEVHAEAAPQRLAWRLHLAGGAALAGGARGGALPELSIQAAQKIARELAASERAPKAWPLDGDPFMTEVFVRGMEAAEQQRFQVALNFLQVCVDADPHPLEVEVEYVMRSASVVHPATLERARKALDRALAANDDSARARVLFALSNYHYYVGEQEPARAAADEALKLFEGHRASMTLGLMTVRRIELALADRDLDLGQRLVDRLLAIGDQIGSDRLVAYALRFQGRIDHLCGDPEKALRSLQRSAELSRALRLNHADLSQTLLFWAAVCRGNGELGQALELIDEAVNCGLTTGMPTRAAQVLALQISMATSAGRADVAHAALERLRTPAVQATRASQGMLHLVMGGLAWREGDLDGALERYAAAEPLLRPFRAYWYDFALELHAALAIEARRFDLATTLIEEIEAHPQYRQDRWLRGSALFLRATMSHLRGAREDCWRLLLAAIETAPPGVVRAHACLGAVWLACEDGQPAQAAVWLREVEPWTREHPHGFAALARWRYASGDLAGAVAAQTACVERWSADPIGDSQRALLALYRRALDAGRVLPLEPLAALPTLRL